MKKKKNKLKRFFIVMLLLVALLATYVAIVNRNSPDMTYRQKILKAAYPLFTGLTRLMGKNNEVLTNPGKKKPPLSFYELSFILNNNSVMQMSGLKGKKVLLVNTASDCGYTAQYAELQELYEKFNGSLVIIGFPANDFSDQEKGSDQEIATFCKLNYGIKFPLASKSVVVKQEGQNSVFAWLTDKSLNGWNDHAPTWNFSKYLVDENGVLTQYFGPSVSPLSRTIESAILQ